MPRSPRNSGPTADQTKEQQNLRQARTEMSDRKIFPTPTTTELLDESAEDKWREREPNLTGLTSEYDLELFRSAQAEASAKYASFRICFLFNPSLFIFIVFKLDWFRRMN